MDECISSGTVLENPSSPQDVCIQTAPNDSYISRCLTANKVSVQTFASDNCDADTFRNEFNVINGECLAAQEYQSDRP